MVKNEEKNINRLITSLKGWIDGVVLCDTGSTDSTVSLTNALLKDLKLPGKVYEYTWENFGKSRTKCFQSFVHWVKNHTTWDPSSVWGLLLDADMVLSDEGGLHAQAASLDMNIGGINIPQRNGSLIYKNTRLVRASVTWRCVGSTHEYWENTDGKHLHSLESPVINDIGDGGCKSDKYERDARLLEEDLKTDPNNVRTHFYLGQTYMSLGKNAEAVKMFTRRVELGGWEEEIYIALIYKGDCLKYLGKPLEAVESWLCAWQLRQHRTEAALRLITYYRSIGNHNFIAMLYIEKLIQLQFGETLEGSRIYAPMKNNDSLFINHTDMSYTLWEELGIVGFYTGKVEAARFRLDMRILNGSLSFEQKNRLTDLYRWYKWKLPIKKEYSLKIEGDLVEFLKDPVWKGYNPSIQRDKDRYLVNLRHANYETVDAKHFSFRSGGSTVITRNVIVEFDANFQVLTDRIQPTEFKIPEKYIVNKTTQIHGLEDCRWIGNNSLIGTSRQFTPSELNKMVRIDFEPVKKTLVRMKPMMCPIPSEEESCQKNWLPFIWKGEECYVYHLNPFRIFTMKGALISSWSSKKGVSFDGLRGSAPPVLWNSPLFPNECLILIAHYSYYGGEARRYYHRFITLDKDLQPSRLSKTFTIANDEAIQYISGMSESLNDDCYIITYGVNDCKAFASEVEKKTIEDALIYKL
jgi:tetratricopeptide (TPR) repeat protein